ncbi:MAG: FHA domain-containing protein FhaB [Firmicutes bacterium ADurb.Bin193]|nr:MAG: FHA domain-containing protein FhaB [Firmicutes bacterium ADurb.Bin193]
MSSLFAIISTVFKYIFITIIYLFIFGIMRMIFLDIRKIQTPRPKGIPKDVSYLQLLTDRSGLYFEVEPAYPLEGDEIVIGRGTKCDISIDDLYMSTQHVRLWFDEGEWYISDLASTNGTYINGIKMTDDPLILDNGDRIKIGQLEFLVVLV